MNEAYENYALLTHYLFIFISLATTSLVYALIFIKLKHRTNDAGSRGGLFAPSDQQKLTAGTPTTTQGPSVADVTQETAVGKHHPAFLVYPVVYVVCTLPLAAGRIATMAGAPVPVGYFLAAGALISCNGFLDVLLWGTTRRSVIFGAVDDADALGLETFTFMRTPHDRKFGNMVWVEAAGEAERGRDAAAAAGSQNSGGSGSGFWERLLRGPGGWRELGRKQGRDAGRPATRRAEQRSISQESLRSSAARVDGMHGIQMDLVTTVVVEVDPDHGGGTAASRMRQDSASSLRSGVEKHSMRSERL